MKIVANMMEVPSLALFQNISHSFDFQWLSHFKLAHEEFKFLTINENLKRIGYYVPQDGEGR